MFGYESDMEETGQSLNLGTDLAETRQEYDPDKNGIRTKLTLRPRAVGPAR